MPQDKLKFTRRCDVASVICWFSNSSAAASDEGWSPSESDTVPTMTFIGVALRQRTVYQYQAQAIAPVWGMEMP